MPDESRMAIPDWAATQLRQPVRTDPDRREAMVRAIMTRVRAEPRPRQLTPPMRASRWRLRGWFHALGGGAVGILIALVIGVTAAELSGTAPSVVEAHVLGDSVVPRLLVPRPVAARAGGVETLRDTVHGLVQGAVHGAAHDTFLDTLRLVEFVFRGAAAHSAVVVGDFNAWERGATVLRRIHEGLWTARTLVPRDALGHYAVIVDDARIVPVGTASAPDRRSTP